MESISYSTLWKAIIRPPRANYKIADLGPFELKLGGMRICRTDFAVKNKRGLNFVCSHFEPLESDRKWKEMPCVIYMHGNSSCRREALDCVPYILQSNMTLCCLDFPGCGLSDGEWISLGWHERDDIEVLIDYLREHRFVSTVGLWGRSMGAVTALLHGDRDPSIAGMVLDSPFSDLKTLVMELGATHTKIPKFLISTAMTFVRSSIRSRADFDCYHLAPIEHVDKCFIPALFATGNQDDFIKPHHTDELYKKYAGDKNVIKFEGDHNSTRPSFFFDSATIFFSTTLQVDIILTDQNMMNQEEKKQFIERMEVRRTAQKQFVVDEQAKKQKEKQGENYTNIDKALGLDGDEMMSLPGFDDYGMGGHFGGGFGNEDEALAAAIAASLQDMNPEPSGMQH